jgi:hypothetical protein
MPLDIDLAWHTHQLHPKYYHVSETRRVMMCTILTLPFRAIQKGLQE